MGTEPVPVPVAALPHRLADALNRRVDALVVERAQLTTRIAAIDTQLAVVEAARKFVTPDAEAVAEALGLDFAFTERK